MKKHASFRPALVLALAFSLPAAAQAQAQSASGTDLPEATVDTSLGSADQAAANEARRQASVRFRSGVALFQEGDYEGALAEFQQAYDAAPSPVVLYNLAHTHLALRNYVAAVEALTEYLRTAGDRITPERRTTVEGEIASLSQRIGSVRVTTNVAGATISIDGHEVGTSPLAEPVRVSTGRHQIVARARGHEEATRTVTVAGGTEAVVELELVEDAVTIVAATAPAPESHRLRRLGWATLGSGIALGAGAGVAFGLAMRARSDYDAAAGASPSDVTAAEAASTQLHRASLAADVLTASAVAFGGAGLVMVLVDKHRREGDERGVSVTPTVSGVLVHGRF